MKITAKLSCQKLFALTKWSLIRNSDQAIGLRLDGEYAKIRVKIGISNFLGDSVGPPTRVDDVDEVGVLFDQGATREVGNVGVKQGSGRVQAWKHGCRIFQVNDTLLSCRSFIMYPSTSQSIGPLSFARWTQPFRRHGRQGRNRWRGPFRAWRCPTLQVWRLIRPLVFPQAPRFSWLGCKSVKLWISNCRRVFLKNQLWKVKRLY